MPLIPLISYFTAQADPVFGKTFFQQRTQGINLARWASGQYHHLYQDTDCINSSLSMTPYYSQTFNNRELGQWFFFNGTNTMRFGPAFSTAGNPSVDVFARNFFLNDNFDGLVTANPRARNFVADFNCYVGFDQWIRGLYVRIDVPLNWTSWDMRLTESILFAGTGIQLEKLGNSSITPSPNTSIIEAWKGTTLDLTNFPDLKQPMLFGRIDGKQKKTGVADITFILGYNFVSNECAHIGLNAWVVAPTGTRPHAEYVFEPILGNGHHIGVGGGATGHYEFWNNKQQSLGILVEGYLLHLFKAKQKRTFDLKANGIGSRYLLIKRFNPDGIYAGEILFGPNVLTRDINVHNDVTGEVIMMLNYLNGGFTFDVGYSIWGRTRDKITITDPIPANTFAVQGDTFTDIVEVNAAQSLSRINGEFLPTDPILDFISTENLNIDSAAHPGCYSNKIFMHLAYTWENCDYLPFIGVGGEAEFPGKNNGAFNQWGVWFKFGVTL